MSVFSFPPGVDPSILLQHAQQQPTPSQLQSEPQSEPQPTAPKSRMKRARNSTGHFRADDPSTPENEAWEQDTNDQTGKT